MNQTFRNSMLPELSVSLVWAGETISGSVSMQLEDALAGGHGRLQDVVFLAQILNGAEEALRVLDEGDEHAERDGTAHNAASADPDHQGDRDGTEYFDHRIVEGVCQDGVFEGDHVRAVDGFEVIVGALLAVEELHHAHARSHVPAYSC